jgi:DNA-directed RNA polymerase specialized sigma24 family protein
MSAGDNQDGEPPRAAERKSNRPSQPGSTTPLEPLVRALVRGEAGAWSALSSAITPHILAITRAHPSMRERKLASREDDVAEVITSALERIARDDFKNLRRYLQQRDESASAEQGASFEAWLYGTVDFTIRDHLRKRFGRAPRPEQRGSGVPSRRDLGSLAERLDDGPLDRSYVTTLGATKRVTVAEIFAYVTEHFDARETLAMQLFYLEEKSAAEIADALGLSDERAADKLIRKLNARLRYHFSELEPSGDD